MPRNIDVQTLNRLVFLIYEAALDLRKWQEALDAIGAAAGGIHTHMFGFDSAGDVALGNIWSGYDPDFIASYRAYYGNLSPRARGFSSLPLGTIVRAGDLAPPEDYLRSEMYNDWVRPQEDMLGGGGGVLQRGHGRMMVFGGNIRSRDMGRLEDDWLALATLLMPHIRQSITLGRTLGTGLPPGTSTAATLLLTDNGALLDANDAALDLMQRGTMLRITPTGRVAFPDSRAAAALRHGLKAIRHGAPFNAAFTCGRDGTGAVHDCRLVHFMPNEDSAPQVRLGMPLFSPCLLLTVKRRVEDRVADQALADHYRLTNAELAIAGGIADGLSLAELAEQRRVSIHTVRDQVKSALTKTGSRRQSELVRLVTTARSTP